METVELGNAVQTAVDWVETRDLLGDTLIIVTADHECGGLVITADNGPGKHPDVQYTSASMNYGAFLAYDHSAVNVPFYALGRNATTFGANSEFGTEELDNTQIFDRVLQPQSHFAAEDAVAQNAPGGVGAE